MTKEKLPSFMTQEIAYKGLAIYADLAKGHDYNIMVHSDKAWHRFHSYPLENQKIIIDRFNTQFSVILELNDSKTDFRDPVQSVWRILQKFNWKPPHDLFQRLTKNDIVEIYLPDQTQLYRSLGYFNYTSYSLSELLFFPWHELFEHQAGFHEKIAGIAHAIFDQQSPLDYHEFSTPYIGREKFSKDKLQVQLTCKAFSPLKDRITEKNEAVIIIWNMELVGDRKITPESPCNLGSEHEKEITP